MLDHLPGVLVPVWAGNLTQTVATVEIVETGETPEIASIYAIFMQVAEYTVG
jgi:hypothetical protein